MEKVFVLERETKNTFRYREEETGEPQAVGTLYIQKWAARQLNGGDVPKKIKVVIEAL